MNSAKITLTMNRGLPDEQHFDFEGFTQCVIGRAEDCDVQLPLDYAHADVSRHHCRLDIDPPIIRVRDLGSRNGTYLNTLPAQNTKVHSGDEIRAGVNRFRIEHR